MNLSDTFIVRNLRVPLKLVLGLMESADSAEEAKSWALSALFHASYTHDDSLRDYLHAALERKGLHPYSEDHVEESCQPVKQTPEQLEAAKALLRSQLKTILDNLMRMRDDEGKPLFSQKNHWWAVFRIFVDRRINGLQEKRYTEFIHLISTLNLSQLNAELDMSTLSNITQDAVFRLPFSKWEKPFGEGTRRLHAYEHMHAIAQEVLSQVILAKL